MRRKHQQRTWFRIMGISCERSFSSDITLPINYRKTANLQYAIPYSLKSILSHSQYNSIIDLRFMTGLKGHWKKIRGVRSEEMEGKLGKNRAEREIREY